MQRQNKNMVASLAIAFAWMTAAGVARAAKPKPKDLHRDFAMLKAGTASRVINNEPGTEIQAATHRKTVQHIRDDLEANALWIASGETGLLFISCDLVALHFDYLQSLLPDIANAAGMAADSILISCTHTHAGPSICGPSHPDKSIDRAYLERLRAWLCEAAREAVSSAEPVEIAVGKGQAEIGYNRRVCFADGSHVMHGDPNRHEATGLEGPHDPQHTALFVRSTGGELKAILHNNTAHPVTFYGADFLSSDFPGLARQYLREVCGHIPVLFFNGTIGDISIHDEYWRRRTPETAERTLARVAHLVAGETLRLLQHADFSREAALEHRCVRFEADLRPLPAERLEWAERVMREYRDGTCKEGMLDVAKAHGILRYHQEFAGRAKEPVDLHAGRVGELAFVTVPCELFCHFGLQLKRRSPFPTTAVFGLVNGTAGYVGSMEGIMGGSWEGSVSIGSRWDVTAGYRLVDEWSRMLHELRPPGRTNGKPKARAINIASPE
jgi:neutral ceramidase